MSPLLRENFRQRKRGLEPIQKATTRGKQALSLLCFSFNQNMPCRIATLATCNLNQWALDFDGNLERVKRSIKQARDAGATYRVSEVLGTRRRRRVDVFFFRRRSLSRLTSFFPSLSLSFKTSTQVGPELELTGYGCEDHFLEPDTEDHAWRCLAELLCSGVADGESGGGGGENDHDDDGDERSRSRRNTSTSTSSSTSSSQPILIDIGLVATHHGARYNVRVFCLAGRVLLVRPKSSLADDGNYRESRYFRAWRPSRGLETFRLPRSFTEAMREELLKQGKKEEDIIQVQETAPIGHAILELDDATLAAESCEELFTPCPPHVALALAGCEIISNGSGSHHQLRKLDEQRLSLLKEATRRCGGVYLYANQRGCDGGRLYYDGCACVLTNGKLVAQGAQFGLRDVEVVVADVDLDDVTAFRGGVASAQEQAAGSFSGSGSGSSGSLSTTTATPPLPPRIRVRHSLCHNTVNNDPPLFSTPEIPHPRIHLPEEEIAFGPAAWLWDYLRRSGAGGFLLPLSGGADSASVAAIVAAMCRMVVFSGVVLQDGQVVEDARRIAGIDLEVERRGGGGEEEEVRSKKNDGEEKNNNSSSFLSSSPSSTSDNTSDSIIDTSGDPRLAALARSLARRLLTTVYLASAEASSPETRARAAKLAAEVGSEHREAAIDGVVEALLAAACDALGSGGSGISKEEEKESSKGGEEIDNGRKKTSSLNSSPTTPAPRPRFAADGGSRAESLALQNVQARSRMVLAFLMAQLGPWVEERKGREVEEEGEGRARAAAAANGLPTRKPHQRGFRLVLGAANVDEALRGYLTKYDCSAADLNPIGGVSKTDLRAFLKWAAQGLGLPSLAEIEAAPPTAELEPTRRKEGKGCSSAAADPLPAQTDEADMGMTYAVS